MSIVCGTDFSEQSSRAVEAAAHLAARLGQPLHLVHALEYGRTPEEAEVGQAALAWAERRLAAVAQRAAQRGAKVEIHAPHGSADEALLTVAARTQAKLIVVAAL